MRTKLFHEATILLTNMQNGHANIRVSVKEKSLITPLATVELADRNISEWWLQHRFSLRRLTVGGGGIINNGLGRGEHAGIYGSIGLNQGINAFFSMPYFTPRSSWGGTFDYQWSRNRLFGVNNEDNRLRYLETAGYALHQTSATLGISYRSTPEIITKVAGKFYQGHITDEVLDRNPRFFGEHGSDQQFLSMALSFELNKTDHYSYPLRGASFSVKAENKGFGVLGAVDQQVARIELNHYQQWRKKIFSAHRLVSRVSQGETHNFFLQRAFGYNEDFVRSYELSVIQGAHFFVTRNDLKYHLLAFNYAPPKFLHWLYDELPFDIYIKLLADAGVVLNSNAAADNTLANEFLLGYGLGFDFVFFNDYAASITYSINRKNQKGIYLHINW